MSTSIFNGIVDFGAALYGSASDPVDVAVSRDGIANGLLHAGDCMGQVRVNYHPIAAARAEPKQTTFETIDVSPAALRWYPMGAQPMGAWPLTVLADGTPYRLRVRVGLSASLNNQNTIAIRVVIAPLNRALDERDRAVDHVYTASATASAVTSATWTAGTSGGSIASATLLTVTSAEAERWVASVNVANAVSGAAPVSIEQVPVGVFVYGRTNGTSLPRLHALHVSEYVGT